MGSFLGNALGVTNKNTGSNPYAAQALPQLEQNSQQIYGQQQALANALQKQAAGEGPNPAQIQFEMNQQQNLANAQGLLAGQRGLNPALAAKLGSNMAAEGGQNAAAQSALMQAQQQLAAQQNLGNLLGQMQSGNLGSQQAWNQANLGAQNITANAAQGNQGVNSGLVGGVLGGLSSFAGLAGGGKYEGGMIKGYDSGGIVDPGSMPSSILGNQIAQLNAPNMEAGKILEKSVSGMFPKPPSGSSFPLGSNTAAGSSPMAGGAADAAETSSGMGSLMAAAPAIALVNKGGMMGEYLSGGTVPGKATVHGDSPKNDKVPAMLSPGEAVLPRSVMNSKDAPSAAAKFVRALLVREKLGKK